MLPSKIDQRLCMVRAVKHGGFAVKIARKAEMALDGLPLGRRKRLDIRSISDENSKAIRLQNVSNALASPDEHCGCRIVAYVDDYGVVEPVRTVRALAWLPVLSHVSVVVNAV